ncbi:hypothetical protein O181_070507 [Austropuccinia psidii MF-1]|uniref:Rho-GAP domain-containing protein n=1 Tax=Austropuccinia psidii MF-1 TaxID=1389203 RepID=A0A9Q3F620_9BASI|nr:hypothetical protein [Austropuccinia psidii MF-1]
MSNSPHMISSRTEDILATYTILLRETESYISFFKKRCEIEDEYQHQLSKLVSRQIDLDQKFESETLNDFFFPQSTKPAWQELTGNIQQEAQLRKNWIKRVKENVLEPLERFKLGKERTLQRIRDELRNSIQNHKEYLNTVQRLKKNYDRKCEEVHQIHTLLEAAEFRDKLIEDQLHQRNQNSEWEHITSRNNSNHHHHHPFDSIQQSNSIPSSISPLTSPQLSRSSLEIRPIISGATSSALRDTATPPPANPIQAKGTDVLQALRANTNNLIQRLNSRKENKSQFPVPHAIEDAINRPSALRGAKVKREAEDADRDYRKGVFHLETLRLRKEQVIRGARRAIEDMVYEISGEAKESFTYYIDETRIQAVSWISICDHAQHLVMKINPETDLRRYTESTIIEFNEPKVLYENAFAGPCLSLLFGVAINDYCASNPGKGWIPLLVCMCIDEIEKRGLKLEGIYRVSGKMQSVTSLVHEIEKDEDNFKFDPDRHDIYTISSVLKLYLRQLPHALFPFPLVERVSFSHQLQESPNEAFKLLSKRIRRLPPAHQATLKLVCEHLDRVASFSNLNKMTPSNLGLVFAPVVFLDDVTNQQLPNQAWKDNVMEVLIEHHTQLFEGLPIAEPITLERSRSQRGTMVNRTLSPSARKSLEAVRFESYSRCGSPQPISSPGIHSSNTTISLDPITLADSIKINPSLDSEKHSLNKSSPQLSSSNPSQNSPATVENFSRRTISLKRRKSRGSSAVSKSTNQQVDHLDKNELDEIAKKNNESDKDESFSIIQSQQQSHQDHIDN